MIRHSLKIRALRTNSRAFMKVQEEWGTFSEYIWHFTKGKPIVNHWQTDEEVPTETELSRQISKDLKKRGFVFIGPVIIYSYLQAVGVVDDHLTTCCIKADEEVINNGGKVI